VTTTETDLSELRLGDGSLEVGEHGSSGVITARTRVESKRGPGFHRITTKCDDFGNETEFTKTDCNSGSAENPMRLSLRFDGGVGTKVDLLWNFFIPGGGGTLVSNVFNCVEPLHFPGRQPGDDYCETHVGLSKLTAQRVKLPIHCFYSTIKPPIGSHYFMYSASARASGSIVLQRVRHG
jgi:hypothetical protein